MTNKQQNTTIAVNKKARFLYFLEEELEAGLVLEGWEVKSLRAGKINVADAHVIIKNNEAFLLGAQIQPLPTASQHTLPDSQRTRKLLLHKKELNQLIGAVQRKGYTIIPVSLYWHKNRVKIKIALAKGKKDYDKRETEKAREWQRESARIMKR